MQRFASALVIVSSVLLPTGPVHARQQLDVFATFNLEALSQRTGLAPLSRPLLIDRGQRIVMLEGSQQERYSAYTVGLAGGPAQRSTVRLGRFNGRAQLTFYDSQHQRAGLLLTLRRGVAQAHYLAHWDLAARRLGQVVELSMNRQKGRSAAVLPIGYSPQQRTFYAAEVLYLKERGDARRVTVLSTDELGDAGRVTRFQTRRRVHRVHYDPIRERALVAEYAEAPVTGPNPVGHLVDLRTGDIRRLPLPTTAYGIAFGQTDDTVHAYSSQTGRLWVIDVASKQHQVLRKVGSLGHAMGAAYPDSLLLVRNRALHLVDARTGRSRVSLKTNQLFDGFTHTEGSLIAGPVAVVKNGDHLALVRASDQ